MIETKPLCTYSSNLANMLTMVRGWTLLMLEVKSEDPNGHQWIMWGARGCYALSCYKMYIYIKVPMSFKCIHSLLIFSENCYAKFHTASLYSFNMRIVLAKGIPYLKFESQPSFNHQKNAALRHKTTCSESESRNFDCQWTLVSILVKLNQFYREARLTCPLYMSTEDICIGICVFKHVFNVWHMLKKVCQCNNILNNLWGNKEELNWSLSEIL